MRKNYVSKKQLMSRNSSHRLKAPPQFENSDSEVSTSENTRNHSLRKIPNSLSLPNKITASTTDVSCSDKDETITSDDFTVKVDDLLEQMQSSKSAPVRLQHYETLIRALTSRFAFEYLHHCQEDVANILLKSLQVRSLSSSNFLEASLAARVASIFFTTLGENEASVSLLEAIFSPLQEIFADENNVGESVRCQCLTALVIGCLAVDADLEEVISPLMESLLKVAFTVDNSSRQHNQSPAHRLPQKDAKEYLLGNLRAHCLKMYSLLVSLQSSKYALEALQANIVQFISCLDDDGLVGVGDDDGRVSIAAGECIALLTEKCRQGDEEVDEMHLLCERLHSLISQNRHHQTKETLRRLRQNYRQILNTLQCGDFADETIKFGREVLQIDTWMFRVYYDTFSSVLGTSTNFHLTQNVWLRELFDLGPIVKLDVVKKSSTTRHLEKVQKKLNFAFDRKERQMRRDKLRGRRTLYESFSD